MPSASWCGIGQKPAISSNRRACLCRILVSVRGCSENPTDTPAVQPDARDMKPETVYSFCDAAMEVGMAEADNDIAELERVLGYDLNGLRLTTDEFDVVFSEMSLSEKLAALTALRGTVLNA